MQGQPLIAMRGGALVAALREILAGEGGETEGRELLDMFMQHAEKLRPAALALAGDASVRDRATALIAALALPEDMAQIAADIPPPASEFLGNRWLYDVVTGLIEPTTDSEWNLLRDAGAGNYDHGWVDAGAILALRLNASPRAHSLLEETARTNTERRHTIDRALAYIDGGAGAVARSDLVAAAGAAAVATGLPGWQFNAEPRYTGDRSAALVDIRYIVGRDILVYTATFHQADGMWRLRAMRETMQALMAMPEGNGNGR